MAQEEATQDELSRGRALPASGSLHRLKKRCIIGGLRRVHDFI